MTASSIAGVELRDGAWAEFSTGLPGKILEDRIQANIEPGLLANANGPVSSVTALEPDRWQQDECMPADML